MSLLCKLESGLTHGKSGGRVADNGRNSLVYPQKADFTFYGGPGIRVTPTVEGADSRVRVEAKAGALADNCKLRRADRPQPIIRLQGKSSNSANWV